VIDRYQVTAFGRNELADHLVSVTRLIRAGLHQRRVGDFGFLVKTMKDICDKSVAE
jgi:hypothetical protein